ncbi:MAG: response regulator transcription factor [Verrucomicrobiota bacterium]|nr:response regulator transcription factor [Verrucomicrobiota bacterium]
MKKKILVVEDDAHIRMGLVESLKSENYDVDEVSDGRQVMAKLKGFQPSLMVLDVMLPGKSGFDLCREIRAGGMQVPILMLTAKGQEVDKVVGLELGADDYMTKPFSVRELLARVNALLRRSEQIAPAGKNGKGIVLPAQIVFGSVKIDTKAMRGQRGKEKIDLTEKELKIIALLHRETGNVVSRNQLLDEVWGMEYYGTTRTLDQVIVKIRQKIEVDPADPVHLLTVHGVGYRLEV